MHNVVAARGSRDAARESNAPVLDARQVRALLSLTAVDPQNRLAGTEVLY